MRFKLMLATTTLLSASAAFAQTTPTPDAPPQNTAPATPAPQTTPDEPQPASTPTPAASQTPSATPTAAAPSGTAAPTAAAPAAGGTVIGTTATTLVQPAVGVTVLDPAGTKVGTIKSMTDQFATLTTAKGDVRLAVSSIGPGPNGAVIGGTAAEIEAAAERAGATPAPASPRARTTRRAPRR